VGRRQHPEPVADAAKAATENGYRTVKLTAITQMRRIDMPAVVGDAADRLAAVWDAVGPDIDIIVDVRGRIASGMVKRVVTALELSDPMYFEGPVLPENARQLPRSEGHMDIPLAMGERMYSRWEFQRSAVSDVVDVVQPSPSHAGGISEVRKIATAAEADDTLVSLHCPLSPISLAVCVHLDMALPNAIVQAQNLDIHDPEDNELLKYLTTADSIDFANDYVTPPDSSKLGVELDEEYLRQRAQLRVDW